jgi:hypothetical protein
MFRHPSRSREINDRTMIARLTTSSLLFGLLTITSQAEPLKVYILAGQSNMEGHAHVKTFAHVAADPESKPLAALMIDGQGEPRAADHTWISYLGAKNGEVSLLEGKLTTGFGAPVKGPKIGPEYTLGLTLEKRVSNPILLIKTAWGGQNITLNFRPPSAGPKKLTPDQIEKLKAKGKDPDEQSAKLAELSGHRYRDMMNHVNDVLANIKRVYPDYDPAQGYEIAGFVWFQGWNDKVDKNTYINRDQEGGYDLYSELLTTFIKDVRKDLKTPDLPFVIGVMGVGGKIDVENGDTKAARNQRFREAMAAPAKLPEFQGNVHAVWTEEHWDDQLGALEDRRYEFKDKIQAVQRNKKLGDEEKQEQIAILKAETFNPEQQKLYDTAISNFAFHYLGSAKIVGRIGIAFADALAPPQAGSQ